jgi:hypothetical protein
MTARARHDGGTGRLWPQVTKDHTNYAGYQRKTDREIPLVYLTPKADRSKAGLGDRAGGWRFVVGIDFPGEAVQNDRVRSSMGRTAIRPADHPSELETSHAIHVPALQRPR